MNKSQFNQAVATELRAAKGAARLSVREIVNRTGISTASVNRLLTSERDISVTQLALLADALDVTPVDLINRAIERVERMEAETPEAERMSVVPDNVTPLRSTQAEDLDDYKGARVAYRDEEADTDEPE